MPSIEDFSSDDLLDDIISAALEYEGQFREAFIGYINQAAQSAEMLDILQDIADGEIIDITPSVEEALRRINISTGNLTDILRQTMESVARTTVESVGVDMVFDMTSPTAIDYANKMAARSITNVSTAAQQSIREVLRQVLQQDMTIAQMRRFVNSRVGLLPSHIGAVQRYYRTLIDGGTPFRRAQVLADEYASRLRMYRADMITRTEIAAAQSWGQWATWQQMRDEELIPLDAFRIWMTAQDERVCDVCGPMNRQVTSLDGQWNTPNGPVTLPTDIHPNCRCAMGITFSRGRAREFLGKGPSTDYDWWMIEKHLAGTSQDHDQSTHGRRRQSIKTGITFGEEYREWVKANGMADWPSYGFEDEESFNEDFGKARSNIIKALKDDVARALGGYISNEMTTAEMVDAVVQLSGAAQETGKISGLLTGKHLYEIDDISLIMLRQAAGMVADGRGGLPFGSADAIKAGVDIGLEAMLERGLIPSRWVLEQAKSVFGEDSVETAYLERQLYIAEGIVAQYDESTKVYHDSAMTFAREMSQDPRSIALASLTEQTVEKIVDKMMRDGGEDARSAVADFLKSAYSEAGVAIPSFGQVGRLGGVKLTTDDTSLPASRLYIKPGYERSGRSGNDELASEVASALVSSWAQSSSSHESTLMMQAAVSELGASPGYSPDDYSLGREVSYQLDRLKPEGQKLIKTVVRAQYEMTQRMFREIGIEEITIARGMSFSLEDQPYYWERGKSIYEANAVLRPLSAWAVDVSDARLFADGGQILFQRVPVERIFSTPMTGLGCFSESECLFIYKDGDVFPIYDLSDIYVDEPSRHELVRIINEYDMPTISKADLPTVYPDARIEDADWPKRTFDFPGVTTAKQYRDEFGLQEDEALAEHIKEWKGTPYWEGIPSKIKTALLKARLSKHLGSQHDQKTHGRRKTAEAPLEDLTGGYYRVRYGSYDQTGSWGKTFAEQLLLGEDDMEGMYEAYPSLLEVSNLINAVAKTAVKEYWVSYGPQAIMRTIASSMMGIGHYASNGDEGYEEKYGDDVMDKVYDGEGPAELVDPYVGQTLAILTASVGAKPSDQEWHRGMVVPTNSPILRMVAGDRFVMPPSSFGGHRSVAEGFVRGGMMEPLQQMMDYEEASVFRVEWRDVIFRLETGAQGVESSKVRDKDTQEVYPFEMVVNGEFEVVSVDSPFYDYEGAEDELVEITIRQVTTYDPLSGEYVEVG